MPQIDVIINAAGGSFVDGQTDEVVADAFGDAGLEIDLKFAISGDEIEKFAETAAKGEASVVVAGGGDGTINAVASHVIESGKTLGVLPLGTLNHFSKDIDIPQDLNAAVGVIAAGHTKTVDVGDVNGRIFINNSSIGLYPRIVQRRELQQERIGRGKWSAAFLAALSTLRRDPFFSVQFELEGRRFTRKTPFVFVGNNEYDMDIYNIGHRQSLTEGKLSVYFLKRGGRWGVIVMLIRTVFGRVKQWKDFETISTEAITIDVRKQAVMVAIDGEVVMMETPLRYKVRPLALSVIVPEADTKTDA